MSMQDWIRTGEKFVPNVLGIYIDTDVIHVSMLLDVKEEPKTVLTIPAVYIFNDYNEVLTGDRAVRYQRCHKEKKLHSVIGFLKDSERFQSSIITESAQKNCLMLMKELKKALSEFNKFTYRTIVVCAVIASSDLKVKRAVLESMYEAGFTNVRTLQPSTAYAISKVFLKNHEQTFAMCVETNGEKQYVKAEYFSNILEILENRQFVDSDRADYFVCDVKTRRESGASKVSYENLAVEAAKGAVYEGLTISNSEIAKGFLCLDMFPWKLGIEILGENQQIYCPLTWIVQGQETIPVRRLTDSVSLNTGVKGKLLKLYAGKSGSEDSGSAIREWDLTSIEREWKQLEAGISVGADHLNIQVELKIDGKTATANFLPLENIPNEQNVSQVFVYVPKMIMNEVQNAAEKFVVGVSRLDAEELRDSIGKGIQMIARQSRELEEFCRTSGEQVHTAVFVEKMLTMADNIEYGIKGVQKNTDFMNYWDAKGLLYTFYQELKSSMQKLSVTPVEADGMYFDPYIHDAMMAEKIDGVEADIVFEQIQKGYFIGDKLFRPARVKVTK